MKQRLGGLAIVLSVCLFSNTSAWAFPIPTGLSSGASFRLVFVTAGKRDASSSDISDYNAFVQSEASSSSVFAGLGALSWTAIASTVTVDARDNTMTVPGTDGIGTPIFLLDATTMVAASYSDLWDGTLLNAIGLDQNLASVGPGPELVWTGTQENGITSGDEPGEGALGKAREINYGGIFTDVKWLASSTTTGGVLGRFYAISQVLFVPSAPPVQASGPGVLALLFWGLLGFGFMRRRGSSNP